MRMKGKLINWNTAKAFGFIQPNGGGEPIFIHKSAFARGNRVPVINEIITFSLTKDKQGRYCAADGTFSGEKRPNNKPNKHHKKTTNTRTFWLYLAVIFLTFIAITSMLGYLPKRLVVTYFGMSFITVIAYAIDKAKAQRGAWRIKETSLHLLSLFGGWPGAAIAQQLLRHKSQKREFRLIFWLTVIVNSFVLAWLSTENGRYFLASFNVT